MLAATLVAYAESSWTDKTSTPEASSPSLTWQTGDLIVVFGSTENGGYTLDLPTTAGVGLSFTQKAAVGTTTSDCHAYLWWAVATADGSGSITSSPSTGQTAARGISVWQYRGSDGIGNTATLSASSAKTGSLVRSADNSRVGFGAGDWNAVTSGTATSPSGGTVRENSTASGSMSQFVADWSDQGAAGTTSYGYTGGGTPKNYGFVWEVLGSSGAAVPTPVNATRTLRYDVKAPVSTARAFRYNVLAPVTATRRLVYGVLASVLATRAVRYDVLAPVTVTRSVRYDVAASTSQVSAMRAVRYVVSAPVTSLRAIRYDVLAPVTATRRLRYDVSKGVLTTRALRYDVRAPVLASRVVRYDVGDVSTVVVLRLLMLVGYGQ